MKKIVLAVVAVLAFTNLSAQDANSGNQTSKGKWLVEVNTSNMTLGSTALSYVNSAEKTIYNFGFDGGFFVADKLAIKGGLGYGGSKLRGESCKYSMSYRLGAKYYAIGVIPISLDVTGASGSGVVSSNGERPVWLGMGLGYASFVSDHVAIESGVRYNLSLNKGYSNGGAFQFTIGFTFHI